MIGLGWLSKISRKAHNEVTEARKSRAGEPQVGPLGPFPAQQHHLLLSPAGASRPRAPLLCGQCGSLRCRTLPSSCRIGVNENYIQHHNSRARSVCLRTRFTSHYKLVHGRWKEICPSVKPSLSLAYLYYKVNSMSASK